jgi:hypothetical protein
MKIGSHVFYRRWPTIGQLLPIARAATQPPVPAPKLSAIGRGILLDASLAGPGRDSIPIGGAAPAGRASYDGQLTIAAVQPSLMMMLAAASPPDFLTLVNELRSGIDPGANLDLLAVSPQSEIVVTGRSPTRNTPPLRPALTAREVGPPAIVPTEGLPPGLDRHTCAPMSTGVAILLEEAIGAVRALARVPMPRVFGPQARAG